MKPMHENAAGLGAPEQPGKMLLTADIAETLTRRHGISLAPGEVKYISRLERQFLERLDRYFSCENISLVSSGQIEAIYQKQLKNEKLPIVSIDDLWVKQGVVYFHINRELDAGTSRIHLAPRHGHQSLEKQAQELRRSLQNNEVALLDRGSIGGGTLLHSVQILRDANIRVRRVYMAVHTEQSLQNLRETLDPSIDVIPLSDKLVGNEWLESRDIVGVSGRPVKGSRGWIPYSLNPNFISAPLADAEAFTGACISLLRKVEKVAGFKLGIS
jgi:hypothetical protein